MAVAKQKSASVSHRREQPAKDERIRRTRAQIDAAFVELLHRRAYGSIRVSDITRKAGVGRATFYAHYAAKDDLLRSQCRRIVAPMIQLSASGRLDATPFFEHIRHVTRIYQAFLGPHGGSAPAILRECFEQRIRSLLQLSATARSGVRADLRAATLAPFIASSLFTVVECWLQKGSQETPAQVQTLFNDLIESAIRRPT